MKNVITTRIARTVLVFSLLLSLCSLPGCMFYYKVQTVNKVTPHEMKRYDSLNKYFIIHQRDSAWHLSKPGFAEIGLSGELSALPENHRKFLTTKTKGGNRYIKNKNPYESCVLDEVHLYISDSLVPERYDSGRVLFASTGIMKTEIYKKAKGRTTVSWLAPVIGGTVLVGGVVAIIALETMFNSGLNLGLGGK